jgi:TetR/AcrR family transcriptional regulator, transcriptional repressor for nem operon
VINQVASPDNTRDRIILAGIRLFAAKGYQSTSIVDLLQEANAHSGSFYHFFPTKQDLLLAVLKAYRDGIEPMLLAPAWRGIDDPIAKVFALLAAYRRALDSSSCTYGCPIGSLALELHEPDPPVRELLSVNFFGWVHHIRTCLDAAQNTNRLPRAVDTEQLAVFVLTTMEGGVMQARTHRSLAAFDASVASLHDYFSRLESAAREESQSC